MNPLVLILFLLLPVAVYGQVKPEKQPWDIGCDTMATQLEMNVCSYEAFIIADSVLTQTYDQLAKYLAANYDKEVKVMTKPATKQEQEYLASLENQKASVPASHANFIVYRDHTVNIIGQHYVGGSIRPLIENQYALELTVNQLNLLTKMMHEIMR